jgi:putative transposase
MDRKTWKTRFNPRRNWPEFISKHFAKWLNSRAISLEAIQPGHPQENGIVERFNETYRREILDANILRDLNHCRELTQEWVREYNEECPHESLGDKTLLEWSVAGKSGLVTQPKSGMRLA